MEPYQPEENIRDENSLSKLDAGITNGLMPGFEKTGNIKERVKDFDVNESQAASANSFDKWLDRFDEKISFDNLFI